MILSKYRRRGICVPTTLLKNSFAWLDLLAALFEAKLSIFHSDLLINFTDYDFDHCQPALAFLSASSCRGVN